MAKQKGIVWVTLGEDLSIAFSCTHSSFGIEFGSLCHLLQPQQGAYRSIPQAVVVEPTLPEPDDKVCVVAM